MAGINVNQITSMLAKLQPDSALQNYAQMHKNDPYIVSLAASESNRRKELRAASQGAQSMQPQPKVADAAIAQMAPQQMAPQQLPEDVGIGQLRAPNLQFAAEGGIMGYDEGYDEGGMTYGQEPVMMMAGGGVARYQSGGMSFIDRLTYGNITPAEKARKEALERQADMARVMPYPETIEDIRKRNMQRVIDADYTRTDPRALASMPSGKEQMAALNMPVQTEQPPPAADKKRDAAPRPGAGPAAAAQLPSMSDLTALRQQIIDKQDYRDPAASGLLELEAAERANAAAERQAVVSDAEKFKDAYKGREGRLAEREADIGKQKDQNTGLALLNAGLAIMSTPGGLATAIGKGAQVGTAQFAAGLDKIRSAQERLGDARDRLEDMKLNREENTAKEIRAAERNYRNVAVNAQKRTIDGIRMAADVNEKRATDIYSKTVDMTKTVYEQEQQNKRTDKQVAASGRNQQLELLNAVSKDPKLAAAYKSMHGKGEDVMGQYNDFLKANPAMALDPKQAFTQFLMTKSAFAQLGAPTVTEKAAGPVRKQP
jgi:hypothetical protein